MRVIEKCAARFENTRIFVHRDKTHKGKMAGRQIWLGGIFKLGLPQLKSRQFLGIQSCLFVTMEYPSYILGLLDVAVDLPGIKGTRPAVWAGVVSCCTCNRGLSYYIPRYLWETEESELQQGPTIVAPSELMILRGKGGGVYYILKIPLITEEYFRKRCCIRNRVQGKAQN